MKKIISQHFLISFFIALSIAITIPVENIYAQNVNRIFDVPGGGDGTNTSSESSNDNSVLYVVGGLVIVGVIVYAVLKNKKEKEKSEQDSIKVSSGLESLKDHFTNYQKQVDTSPSIPINLFLGAQRDLINKDEKRYFVGLSYNF
ncbi:MAG: hypothetical protein MUO34_12230 [Ignavibacteriaceae bacterium]|nr:hypothetical protein [Ignavibacteriaceae bacterium]